MSITGLDTLCRLSNAKTRSISAENFTGEKGKGGMATQGCGANAARDLGQGWKVSPCIVLESGKTYELASIAGPGAIQHIWTTLSGSWRHVILRIYWENSQQPSVECPLGDFFASADMDSYRPLSSLAVCVNPARGGNCYWRMPFQTHCRITVENIAPENATLFYQIDYELDEQPENIAYFHAQFRRVNPLPYKGVYTIVDGIRGKGQYVGTYLFWGVNNNGWWGEGEIKFYYDGDREYPSQCSTGMEDYFGGAWSFAAQEGGKTVEQTYCTPFMGYPFYSRDDSVHNPYYNQDLPPQRGFYRWHIPDPIYFEKELRVTCQQIGVSAERGLFERADDVSSVAYWYQSEPHARFAPLPSRWERIPR